MAFRIKPEDVTLELRQDIAKRLFDHCVREWEIASILNAAIEAGLVSPPCYFITYPSGMPVMYEPGEPIQIFPGKGDGPHCRHWKGQTE